jgi:hypothetical protein
MAVGFASARANAVLDAEKANWTHIQLHTADPGASGTSSVAGNDTRLGITWGSASAGAVANSAAIEWSDAEVDTAEDYTHFSLWNNSSGGTFAFSGTVTANAVSATGDAFRIAVGALSISLTVAS